MIRSLILIISFIGSLTFAWTKSFAPNKHQTASDLYGTWICKNPSATNPVEGWLNGSDTLQFFSNGIYTWKQGAVFEAGKWQLEKNQSIQLFDRQNSYHQRLYNDHETGTLFISLVGVNENTMALNFYSRNSEERYYFRK